MRSEVTSRSNWAKDRSTLSAGRPMEVVVLNCWVTESCETPWASNSSTSLAKSANDLVTNDQPVPVHDNPRDQLCEGAAIPQAHGAGCRLALFGSKMLLQRSYDGVFDVRSGNAGDRSG